MNERHLHQTLEAQGRDEVLRALLESGVYIGFAEDFSRITGLPVSLTPVETWRLAHHPQSRESSFCALLARQSATCAACLRIQHKLTIVAAQSTRTLECVHGLCETAVPVRAGDHVYGFIRTGQVFRRAPTLEGFERVRQRLARWSVTLDAAKLREAYFATRVMAPALYHSAVGLLNLMGRHLSLLSNQLLLERTSGESPMIAAAKKFIEANCHEPLTLRRVAEAVHTSRFNFSKQFKLVTGINFVRYVARLRVEKAKSLLLNPHYRVSEVAYAVGFGSSSHFNRMFERFAGLSPTDFRSQLAESQKTRKRDRCVARSLAPGPIGPRPPPAALNAFDPSCDSTTAGRNREGERVPLVSSKAF